MRKTKLSAAVLCIALLLGLSTIAHAQVLSTSTSEEVADTTDLSSLTSPEAVNQLVSRLSDSEVRDLLLQQLDAVATKQAEVEEDDEQSLFTLVTTNVPLSVQQAFSHIGGVIPGQQKIFGMFIDKLGENGVWKLLSGFLLCSCWEWPLSISSGD